MREVDRTEHSDVTLNVTSTHASSNALMGTKVCPCDLLVVVVVQLLTNQAMSYQVSAVPLIFFSLGMDTTGDRRRGKLCKQMPTEPVISNRLHAV